MLVRVKDDYLCTTTYYGTFFMLQDHLIPTTTRSLAFDKEM